MTATSKTFFLYLGVIVCVLYIVSGLFIVLLVLCFTSMVSFKGFNTEDEPNLYFTSKARDNLESFILFITIITIVKLNLVHVLQTRENLVISSCFFCKDDKEMYQELKRTCTTIVLLVTPFFSDVPIAIAVVVYVTFLL